MKPAMETLVDKALEGDLESLEELIAGLQDRVYGLAIRMPLTLRTLKMRLRRYWLRSPQIWGAFKRKVRSQPGCTGLPRTTC